MNRLNSRLGHWLVHNSWGGVAMLVAALLFLAIMLGRDATGPEMRPGPIGVVAIIITILVCIVIPLAFGLSSVMTKIQLAFLRRRLRRLEETIKSFHPDCADEKIRSPKDLRSPAGIPEPIIALMQRHWIMEQEIRRLESGRALD